MYIHVSINIKRYISAICIYVHTHIYKSKYLFFQSKIDIIYIHINIAICATIFTYKYIYTYHQILRRPHHIAFLIQARHYAASEGGYRLEPLTAQKDPMEMYIYT